MDIETSARGKPQYGGRQEEANGCYHYDLWVPALYCGNGLCVVEILGLVKR